MKKFLIKYLDNSLIIVEKEIKAACKEMAEVVFSNKISFVKILEIKEI